MQALNEGERISCRENRRRAKTGESGETEKFKLWRGSPVLAAVAGCEFTAVVRGDRRGRGIRRLTRH